MAGFAPSNSVFPSQYHPTTDPYSSSTTRYSYNKDKRARPGKLKKNSKIGCHCRKKFFRFRLKWVNLEWINGIVLPL
jgi:hypothetical protein